MTVFPMISRYFASLPRVCAKSLFAIAALAALGVSGATPARAGAYDGTWTTVFATSRGNCSLGLQRAVPGERQPGLLGRRWPGLRLGRPRRQRRRGGLESAPRMHLAAAGWSAIPATAAGAASSPATAAAAPGRRRAANAPDPKRENGPSAGRFLLSGFAGPARISAAPAPSPPGVLRTWRPAPPWRTGRHRPSPCRAVLCRSPGGPFRGHGSAR